MQTPGVKILQGRSGVNATKALKGVTQTRIAQVCITKWLKRDTLFEICSKGCCKGYDIFLQLFIDPYRIKKQFNSFVFLGIP